MIEGFAQMNATVRGPSDDWTAFVVSGLTDEVVNSLAKMTQ